MRIDHQINLLRLVQIGLPLSVVFGIGGLVLGLCTTSIIAGFFLWEYQANASYNKKLAKPLNDYTERHPEALNPKGPTFF